MYYLLIFDKMFKYSIKMKISQKYNLFRYYFYKNIILYKINASYLPFLFILEIYYLSGHGLIFLAYDHELHQDSRYLHYII